MHPTDDFRAAMIAAGYTPPAEIIPGRFHRFSANGRKSDTAGYCKMFDDERGGIFGDFRTSVEHTWQAEREDTLSPAQRDEHRQRIEQARREREAELERVRAEARAKAASIWEASDPANDDHPYLQRKGIQAHGARLSRGSLVIPARSMDGTIQTLQFIDPDGGKLFLKGGMKRGCYFKIGGAPVDTVLVAEGFATGASLHEATGHPVAVAFDAGNLEPVAQAIRDRLPAITIKICADNDNAPEQARNTGMEAATKAAQAVGAQVVAPEVGDFNDLAQSKGLEAVAATVGNDNLDPIDLFAEFPVPVIKRDMLPAAIADYAFDQGELVGVEPAMIAIPALVACAAALHDGVQLQVKRHETGWRESARLWCAVVGNPSIKKSPSIAKAISRVRKINADLADDNQKTIAKHAAEMEAYKDAKKEAKKTGEHVKAPEQPQLHRLVVQDTTVEAMSEVLKDNPRGVLCLQDELSGWFGAMDAYSGGKAGGKDRAHWLETYNGGGRTVDRVMRGSINIPNWSVCMIGGIQPDAIRRIAQSMTDDGLMQRFMIVVGRNAKEHDRHEDSDAHNRYRALVDHLHRVQPSDNAVRMCEDAHAIREALNRYTAELMDYGALPSHLVSHLGKWSGLFARLTLLFHTIECHAMSQHPAQVEVSGDTARRVDQLMRKFLLPHALAFYTDVLGAATELEHARWIAGHILSKRLDVITKRDLMVHYKQWRGLDDWKRQKVMQVLEDMGWLVAIGDSRETRRGAHTWAVTSSVHAKFATKAAAEAEKRAMVREEMLALKNA